LHLPRLFSNYFFFSPQVSYNGFVSIKGVTIFVPPIYYIITMSTLPGKNHNTIKPRRSISSIDDPFVEFESSEFDSTPPRQFTDAFMFVVLCPPDGGPWAIFTCMLGFMALLICDGICLSFILLDGRVGMVENLPPGTRTFEHLAMIYLVRHLTGTYTIIL